VQTGTGWINLINTAESGAVDIYKKIPANEFIGLKCHAGEATMPPARQTGEGSLVISSGNLCLSF
jgi:hypothetical protein